ncbi:hypothetical protein pb186bvf_007232 [Paramecium bursaria]
MKYNSLNPLKITINQWNKGIRVSFPEFYPQGDNGEQLKFGNSVFTKDTGDAQSKGIFCHRYFDFHMNIIGGMEIQVHRQSMQKEDDRNIIYNKYYNISNILQQINYHQQ